MRGSSFSFYGIADVFDAKFCVKNENVYLYSSHMSFGHIRIDGITNVLNIVSHNEQKVDCGALISTKTYISAKGIGEIITNTSDTLYLSVFRSFKLVEVGSAVIDTMEYYSPYSLVRGK